MHPKTTCENENLGRSNEDIVMKYAQFCQPFKLVSNHRSHLCYSLGLPYFAQLPKRVSCRSDDFLCRVRVVFKTPRPAFALGELI